MANGLGIRRAGRGDVPVLLSLGAEHAAFERLTHHAGGRPEALACALGGEHPQLHAWIATVDGLAAGYVSATLDFSTLDGALYLHMDCLYVCESWRGRGIGLRLWEVVRDFARSRHCATIQWQTPWWNLDAARFYRRLGASEAAKLRYSLSLEEA